MWGRRVRVDKCVYSLQRLIWFVWSGCNVWSNKVECKLQVFLCLLLWLRQWELTLSSSLSTILWRGLDLNLFKQQDIRLLAFCEVNVVQPGDWSSSFKVSILCGGWSGSYEVDVTSHLRLITSRKSFSVWLSPVTSYESSLCPVRTRSVNFLIH